VAARLLASATGVASASDAATPAPVPAGHVGGILAGHALGTGAGAGGGAVLALLQPAEDQPRPLAAAGPTDATTLREAAGESGAVGAADVAGAGSGEREREAHCALAQMCVMMCLFQWERMGQVCCVQ
jgi:hypothetical protein